MPEDYKAWIFIFFFIVLPLLQWIVRKVTEAKAAQAKAEPGGAPPVLSRRAGRAGAEETVEEEELPDWIDPSEWESVEEAEAETAPTPRRTLFDEPPDRPGPLPAEERPATRELPPPRPAVREPVRPSLVPDEPRRTPAVLEALPAAARTAIAAPPPPSLRARPAALPPGSPAAAGAGPLGGFPGGIADLRRAVAWSEILGKPRALEPYDAGDPASR